MVNGGEWCLMTVNRCQSYCMMFEYNISMLVKTRGTSWIVTTGWRSWQRTGLNGWGAQISGVQSPHSSAEAGHSEGTVRCAVTLCQEVDETGWYDFYRSWDSDSVEIVGDAGMKYESSWTNIFQMHIFLFRTLQCNSIPDEASMVPGKAADAETSLQPSCGLSPWDAKLSERRTSCANVTTIMAGNPTNTA